MRTRIVWAAALLVACGGGQKKAGAPKGGAVTAERCKATLAHIEPFLAGMPGATEGEPSQAQIDACVHDATPALLDCYDAATSKEAAGDCVNQYMGGGEGGPSGTTPSGEGMSGDHDEDGDE